MKVIEPSFAEKWTRIDRDLLHAADKALQASRALLEGELLYHANVAEALRQSEIATAKLQKLEIQLKGVETPRVSA